MEKSTSKAGVPELVSILHRVVVHRPRLKAVLPEDVVKVREQVKRLHVATGESGLDNYDLLFGIGVILHGRSEGVTMSEVSRSLSVPTSTATRIIDSLVNAGYIARQADNEDRRIVRVVLTPAGEAAFHAANNHLRKRLTWMLRHFTPAEQAQLVKLLGKLADALDEEFASTHEGVR